ncbi:xylan 1,4-beta-xylosidase [Streptomyces sp. NBC_01795]|nr:MULTISPECIES: xylan 1,4-beta-xylosidase [unclassified Streptomyces]WSA97434.1 xylan 1,4-beta-xylosidase [Streptomyces sp. NBC_01795]WSB81860.1 xylan 1,4-beta-xylosidase [Streptomyces sp. NBC_01775]WSS17376.1 xylan 1,4-beta-xylosidase [Streptomyces sp. NBC_01186]WSS46120.1 xylan 1,4-beta-xylosidase [Streptomyces sp. NBC_01187]
MNVARWRLTGLVGAGVVALALALAMCGFPPGDSGAAKSGPGVYGSPPPRDEDPGTELGWGFTHTKTSADEGGKAARERAAALLKRTGLAQNQHIMGWGADNPEPSPGRYDFEALDKRVELMRRSGVTPVITLCCAPDWMKKGGRQGSTDWSELETAPSPQHYDDFAELAGVIARRYPDVQHFMVWNELKGFWDDGADRWDYEGYTRLYNLVHAQLKKASPRNLVGGPYVVMDSVGKASHNASKVTGPWGALDRRALDAVRYWNRHKRGADFAVVDGSSYTADDRLVPDEFAATDKLTAVSEWMREETGLPLWWAEWYAEVGDENDERDGWSERHRLAVQASALAALARGGTDAAFYWNPQNTGRACAGCLWRGTQLADGGGELPMMRLLARFQKEFPPGTRWKKVRVRGADAAAVRTLGDDERALAVNTRPGPVSVRVAGDTVKLKPYEVRWLAR